MPLTLDQLRQEILALPRQQQSELIASVSSQENLAPLGLHPSWEAELHRRSEAYRSGDVEGIPWEVVKKELESLDDLP